MQNTSLSRLHAYEDFSTLESEPNNVAVFVQINLLLAVPMKFPRGDNDELPCIIVAPLTSTLEIN